MLPELSPEQLDRIAAVVGADAFAHACAAAWATVEGAGDSSKPSMPTDDWNVFDNLNDWLDAGWADLDDPMSDAFGIYASGPCYWATVIFRWRWRHLAEEERAAMWAGYRSALDHNDPRLANPIGYSLWVDWFEDGATVEAAWSGMTVDLEIGSLRARRLLDASGPVPWGLKAPLLDSSVGDSRSREAVLGALLGGAFDYFGQIDVDHARRIFARLPIMAGERGVPELRKRLGLT